MARGRMVTNNIMRDRQINLLSDDTCRLAFTWLITLADKEGRTYGDPTLLRSMLFPRRDDVTTAQLEGYIIEWVKAGFVQWYEANGDRWIQFVNFDKNQPGLRKDREPASEIPAPPLQPADELPEPIRQAAGKLPDDIPPNGMEWNGMEHTSGDGAPDGQVAIDPIKKRRLSVTQERRATLEAHFVQVTGIPPPERSTDKERKAAAVRWWKPLDRIATLSGGDTDAAKALITETVRHMRGQREPLTIAAPQSIVSNATDIASKRRPKHPEYDLIPIPPDEVTDDRDGTGSRASVDQPQHKSPGDSASRPRGTFSSLGRAGP